MPDETPMTSHKPKGVRDRLAVRRKTVANATAAELQAELARREKEQLDKLVSLLDASDRGLVLTAVRASKHAIELAVKR